MITLDPEKITDAPMTFAFETQLAHMLLFITVYYCMCIVRSVTGVEEAV